MRACYLLVITNYVTRYPEAVPLSSLASSWVAQVLMRFFPHVVLPNAIPTNKGSPFHSALMKKVCQVLGIEQLFAVVQHPQMGGLMERN